MKRFISSDKVFAHMGRLVAWDNGATPGPVTLEWDLTNRCSLGCHGCHFAHTHTRGPWAGRALLPMAYEGTGDVADEALVARALGEASAAGVRAVVWTGGGEPTLHPRWTEIVAHGAAYGLRQGMYTHGGHLTPAGAATLARAADWVVVSLDAETPDRYAAEKGVPAQRFDDACRGARALADAGLRVLGVSFLLHAGNWQRAEAMLDLGRSLGATYVTFRPLVEYDAQHPGTVTARDRSWVESAVYGDDPYGGGVGPLRLLANEPDVELDTNRFMEYGHWQTHGYSRCLGVRLNATVTPDGRVWVCPNRRGMPESLLGDLRTERFGDLWARHPGSHAVDGHCRAMCRLHAVNQTLDRMYAPREHAVFV